MKDDAFLKALERSVGDKVLMPVKLRLYTWKIGVFILQNTDVTILTFIKSGREYPL